MQRLPQRPELDELGAPPIRKELLDAVNGLKDNAPGASGISPRVWKIICGDAATLELFDAVVQQFWQCERPPEEWDVGLLRILPKKGDLSRAGNHRGINLLEAAYKVVASILRIRLTQVSENLEHELNEYQYGFRPNRGCPDATFSVKTAMKKRREHGQETWILFLDLVKAFDRVPRAMLWEVLLRYGVPSKLVRLLQCLHSGDSVKFTVGETEFSIPCSIGVKQGDVLGPILFILYIAAVMHTWRESDSRPMCIFRTKMDNVFSGRRHNTRGSDFPFPDSEYADDTAVMFVSRESLETGAPKLISHFEDWGLEVHMGLKRGDEVVIDSKTEVLFVAAPARTYQSPADCDGADLSDIDLGQGKFLPIIESFKYLGTVLARDCTDSLDVDSRISAAGRAFGVLRKCFFSAAGISYKAKKAVYEGLVLSILLYGSESWCLTEKLMRRLRCFHALCMRRICRVSMRHVREHRISNEQLRQRIGLQDIAKYIFRRQLQWAGHVWRMPETRLPQRLVSSWLTSRRPRGCPEFTYARGLKKALRGAHIPWSDWTTIAQDRCLWRDKLRECFQSDAQ